MKIGITERGDAALHRLVWSQKRDSVDGLVLITKDPATLLSKVDNFDKCIVHCTITGWGETPLEPYVPSLVKSMKAYDKLVDLLGPERVVLRVDPIVPVPMGFGFAKGIVSSARGRVRISFLDLYKHVWDRIRINYPALATELAERYAGQKHGALHKRQATLEKLQKLTDRKIEVCGEPGIECSGCVSSTDLEVLGLATPFAELTEESKQRAACSCLAVKTELLENRNQCSHSCLYCYWR
jgi:DNA repair photolyase